MTNDQITVNRELLRQAIDALSDTQTDGESPQWDIEKAAYDALRTALEQPVQEPIGWYWEYNGRPEGKVFFGKAPDQDVIERGLSAEFPCIVRYVYTSPQAQQLEGGPPGSGGWESYAKALEQECSHWRTRAQTMCEHQSGEVWYWQGDGGDHIESMCNSLPVVIRADQLRQMLTPPQPAPVQEPVARVDGRWYGDGTRAGNTLVWAGRNAEDDFPVGTEFYTAPQAPQPAPVQEPVAWVWNPAKESWEQVHMFGHWQQGAIYAFGPEAPQAQNPLPSKVTDEMHKAACKVLFRASGLDGLPQRMLDAMRATAPQAQQPVPPADVPMLTDEEIKDAIRHLYKDETALQMSMDITLHEYRAIEQAVHQKAGLK